MSFLICGATGGVGSALARRLRRSGEGVHLVGRNEVKLAALAEEIGATFGVADVTDASALFKAVRGAGDQLSSVLTKSRSRCPPHPAARCCD
jgi:NADP-dependent 3-hydroxy acid dehydrogenase YdfG